MRVSVPDFVKNAAQNETVQATAAIVTASAVATVAVKVGVVDAYLPHFLRAGCAFVPTLPPQYAEPLRWGISAFAGSMATVGVVGFSDMVASGVRAALGRNAAN